MTLQNVVPAYELAKRNGVKLLLYGPPGEGKTPLLDTLKDWNPIVCVVERGMLAMAHSSIACFKAETITQVKEFTTWYIGSNEARQFGVPCFDSLSRVAELALQTAENKTTKGGNENRGKQAYGEMSRETMSIIEPFLNAQMHIVALGMESKDEGQKRPYFPGQDLYTKLPHRFTWIARLSRYSINGQTHRALLNRGDDYSFLAREQSGRLEQYEQPDLGYLFNKLLA